jgi:hypothetical protein
MEETRLKSRVPAFHKVNSIRIREGVVDCVKGGRRGAHVRPLWGEISLLLLLNDIVAEYESNLSHRSRLVFVYAGGTEHITRRDAAGMNPR